MNTKRWLTAIGAAAVLALPVAAHAQEPYEELGDSGMGPASGYGVELLLGGGYSNFTGSTAREYSSGAGTWNLRGVFGSRLPVGFEAAYVGSAQDLNVTGLDTGAYLLGNGVEGSLRLAIPIEMGWWMVAPFATAGVGWNYYSLQSTDTNTSIISEEDSNFTLPLAVGLDAVYQGFTMSARLTYRPSFDDDILGGADLSTWGVTGNIGFEF